MKLRCFITEPTLTSPVLPHSGQQCSSRAPPWTSASAGSANHPRSGWREELHHRTANPGQGEEAKRELTSSAQFLGNQNKRSVSAAPTEKCCGVRPTEGGRKGGRNQGFLSVRLHLTFGSLKAFLFYKLNENKKRISLYKATGFGYDVIFLVELFLSSNCEINLFRWYRNNKQFLHAYNYLSGEKPNQTDWLWHFNNQTI